MRSTKTLGSVKITGFILLVLAVLCVFVLVGPFLVGVLENESDIRLGQDVREGAAGYESLLNVSRALFFWNEWAKPIPLILWLSALACLLSLLIYGAYVVTAKMKANRVLIILEAASHRGSDLSDE